MRKTVRALGYIVQANAGIKLQFITKRKKSWETRQSSAAACLCSRSTAPQLLRVCESCMPQVLPSKRPGTVLPICYTFFLVACSLGYGEGRRPKPKRRTKAHVDSNPIHAHPSSKRAQRTEPTKMRARYFGIKQSK